MQMINGAKTTKPAAAAKKITLRAIHQINHDRTPIQPGTVFDATEELAEYLQMHGAAQLATEKPYVAIEQIAPDGMRAIGQVVGQKSNVFTPTKATDDGL
jgi:hypothetical protein